MPTEHTGHNAAEVAAADAAAAPVTEEGYQRGLGSRQIQMIAIGGAIGTGLFLGAGKAIHQAGPSLIMMYAIAGVIIFFIMRALGELLTYRPVSGSFADYAREFLGPFWGFVTGWTYWLMWVVTGMAEVTAASVYITYWWKDIPQWISALVFLLVLFGVNLISVKVFGEVEFWFSMIKVTAIIGMILIGIGVLTIGFSAAGDTASLSHLWGNGGVFPNGVGKSLMTLQIVMFAYLAVELVGVTAGEAENPRETLPKAINTLPWRIGVFYVGALIVILGVVSWTEFQPGVSPFVAAFAKIGIPFGAAIVNFVVLTAALSSCNSGMYSTGRMLRDLAVNGQGPRAFAKLNSRQTPATGILISVALMGIGVWINYVDPDGAFTYITAFATVAGVWTWAMILISHLRYRAAVKAGRAAEAWFKAPGAPYTSWIALIFLAGVMVLIGIDKDARISLYSAPVWFAILGIGYAWLKRRNPEAFAPKPHVAPEPALVDAAG
ncbi:amino acid permease [Streptomyces sp. H39-S7]|uniref:amino acid permease n=1 Tax=Streptomyces sp. H39-S7 TaxID=3004357 RepID=UPI0022AF9274|nr:amino acid permease [Streptomyces sp. H39-S7]MCZ4118838.1 amino acid permease [Streptomyces sp. H39-S7]